MRSSTSVDLARAADRPQAVVGRARRSRTRARARGTRRSSSGSAPRRCAAGRARAAARRSRAGRAGSRARPSGIAAVYVRPTPVSRHDGARTAIVWFRRDLRVHDHPALHAAAREYDRVVPVFVLDDALLRRALRQRRRARAFMLGCLRELDAALRERGAGARASATGGPRRCSPSSRARSARDAVLWTSDVSPYARARDAPRDRGAARGRRRGAPARRHATSSTSSSRGRRPAALHASSRPFYRAWRRLERRPVLAARPRELAAAERRCAPAGVPSPRRPRARRRRARAGPRARRARRARSALDAWLDGADRPLRRPPRRAGARGTSRLSPYLRWGCLSARECEAARARAAAARAPRACVRQLAWRDFYAHVAAAPPRQRARTSTRSAIRDLEWDDDAERLAAWKEGRTGYPLVDAGMRQLARDRLDAQPRAAGRRLVPDEGPAPRLAPGRGALRAPAARRRAGAEQRQLAVDRRRSASTPRRTSAACTTPCSSSASSTPTGEYVRRWVPELRDVPDERLAEPWTMTPSSRRRRLRHRPRLPRADRRPRGGAAPRDRALPGGRALSGRNRLRA